MERLTEKVLEFTQLKACGNDFCKETCAEHDEEKDCNNCPIQKAFEKLAEYEDLEEQGKLLKLPCAVGDKIYYLTGTPNSLGKGEFDRVGESKAVGFYVNEDGLMIRLDYNWHGNHGTYGFFGKTIFLTREEAEAALKEL